MADPNIARFRRVVEAAWRELEARREEINDLNVFPVADGDTGDNMAMTMRSVVEELEGLDERTMDEVGRDEVVHAVARAALLGARGNSGVILSQIVRGAAEELVSRPGELVDPVLTSAALARARDAAYESVREPAEGTMLSAVAAMASRVAHDLAHIPVARLDPDATQDEQDAVLAEALEGALEAGKEALERGPEQLPVLREAGVVDAGAYGLLVMVAGVVAALRGETRPDIAHQHAPPRSLHLPQHESSEYRFCTNFAVIGDRLEGPAFVPQLERIGDCVLVVGDDQTLRVHVHTDDPDAAAGLFAAAGEVSRFDVADMRAQMADRDARLRADGQPPLAVPECAVVAVSGAPGVAALFRSLGASVVDGGPTLNPSTYELLAGIHAAPGPEVLVLPNSPNVLLAAQRAAELSDKPARVVPTRSQQEGLAAVVAFDSARPADDNARTVGDAATAVRCGGVAPAARDDGQGRFGRGDAVGYVEEELVAWGAPRETLAATVARLGEGAELLTCIAGEGAPLAEEEVAAVLPDWLELDFHDGGQSAWWYLLSCE